MSQMRESIARSTDFLTGEVKEITKLKPVNAMAKAMHTVQLFDAQTGDIVKEVESENFIGIVWDDIQKAIAKFAFMGDAFQFNRNNSRGIDIYSDYENRLLTHYQNYQKLFGVPINFNNGSNLPFRYMLLTNDGSPESPTTERVVKGKVIGYSERETLYSGSDTKKGSFNSAESFIEDKHIKFVWDFPTHSANGIIKSVVWNHTEDRNHDGAFPHSRVVLQAPEGYHFTERDRASAKGLNGTLYVLVKPTATKDVYGNTFALAEYTIDELTATATFVKVTEMKAYTTDNISNYRILNMFIDETAGHVYYYHADNFWTRYSLTTGLRDTTNWFLGQSSVCSHRGFGVIDGTVFYGTTTINIRKLSDGTTVAPSYTFPYNEYYGAYPEFYGLERLDANRFVVHAHNGGGRFVFDSYLNGLEASDEMPIPFQLNYGKTSFNVNCMFIDKDGDYSYMRSYDISSSYGDNTNQSTSEKMTFYVAKSGMLGGRNLLPTPIEKTADYTMKVTYDLYFE